MSLIKAPGHWDGRHFWYGCILWDTDEMGPCPALVTEFVRARKAGRLDEAAEIAMDIVRRITTKGENRDHE